MSEGLNGTTGYTSTITDHAERSASAHTYPGRVLMYHGILRRSPSAIGLKAIDVDGFVRQMRYLKQHFEITHPDDYDFEAAPIRKFGKSRIMLTFDDGFANNATVAWPVLEDLRIPAVFFVNTRTFEPGRYIWFIHARALFTLWSAKEVQLLGERWKLGRANARERALRIFYERCRTIDVERIYRDLSRYPVESFVPANVIEEEMRGMTEAEVAAISNSSLMVIGAHTCNHPFLTTCTSSQLVEEITGAKLMLEGICGKAITLFAYPDGDYDAAVAAAAKKAGFKRAFSVQAKPHIPVTDPNMALPRVGIFRPSLGVLAMKSYGVFPQLFSLRAKLLDMLHA